MNMHEAGVHAERVEEPLDDRLEHFVHVLALCEVEAGVAHQLEVAAACVELVDQAHVVGGGPDIAGETLRELVARVKAVLRRLTPETPVSPAPPAPAAASA